MRARHTPHNLPAFPVYSSTFLSPNELVLGGGGGTSRSGIKNKLRLYHVGDDRNLELVDELELEKGEDAPMSMAAHGEKHQFVCGINSAVEQQAKGHNENCRAYGVKDGKLCLLGTEATLNSGDEEDYQKVTVISPDGAFVAVAGMRDLSLLTFPGLLPVAQIIHVEKGEIYDATFSSTTLVVATTVNLLVYALPKGPVANQSSRKSKKGKEKARSLDNLELVRTVEPPAALGEGSSTFRAARFHAQNDGVLYTVTNTLPVRSRQQKTTSRKAFVCRWNTESWTVEKMRKVGDKGVTCFDVSPNGRLLGFGSSDYTIGLLDANTLSPMLSILKAHDFPPTTLRFNPTSTLVVSGSADNSVRVVRVPDSAGGKTWGTAMLIVLTLLIILLAIFAQMFTGLGIGS